MCGIIGIVSKKPVVKGIMAALRSLEYRGYDSAGVALVNEGQLLVNKDVGHVAKLTVDESLSGAIGIGHCRWATHGGVTKANAHPHTDCTGNIAIVHNGIIENFEELRAQLLVQGHVFKSATDSEVIAHLIEAYMGADEDDLGEDLDEAFGHAIGELKGSYAIVAMYKDCDYLMAVRKDSPLLMRVSDNEVRVASDVAALGCLEGVQSLAEGVVTKIALSEKNSRKDESAIVVPTVNHDGYDHYMLKEIYEQPIVMKEALRQDKVQLLGLALEMLRKQNVIWTACGTSRFASIVGRYLVSKLGHCMSETIVGSELHYFGNSFGDNTLILAVSQSGETADVLTGVKLAKERGSYIAAVVNKPYSSLERLADTTLFMNCGPEIAVASTKAFTNELIVFYLLAFTMANKFEEGVAELQTLPDAVKQVLERSGGVKAIAAKIKDAEHIYYIGKGINFAVAGECALKLKEVSYIHAESMSAGELKHGTLALVEEGVPVIGLCPDDYTYHEVVANLHEAQARKGLIIGISDKPNDVFDFWLPIPKVKDIYYPLVSAIVGQLLAYYVAVARGVDVDKPRNLAKSVTVR